MTALVSFHSLRKIVVGLILMLAISLIVPVFVFTVKASPSTWSIETVDASASVGVDTSIAVDSNGYPHISYYDAYWGNLKYAKWTGSAWDIAAPLDDGDGDNVGAGSSIGVDSNDYPHISYIDSTNSDLKYAMWNGTAWSIETIHTVAAAYEQTSIALDSEDHPHISYIRDGVWWLSYGVWGGMNWSFVSIDTSCDAMYPSIAVDSLDRPHISYYDYTNRDLKYARWTGLIWINETVDFDGDVGTSTSIALDSDDNPHISYYDSTNADLKYAWSDGTTWNIETVDSSGNVGEYTSIALDSNGYPHISYKEGFYYNLKYARWTGSVWAIESVDTADAVGPYCSIALDSGDHPHISYWDNTNSNLKYARAPDEYFYSVSTTAFDSNSDGFSDAVQVNMDVDTTYGGALNVFVYAYLRGQLDNYVAFDDPLWSITTTVVEDGEALLYLPADAQEGYYDVELFLFDADYNYEDYLLFEDEVYLYPSQIGWLQGTVKDVDTELPMSTVDIYVNGTYETSTNATGQYSLELLSGDYEITADEWEGSLYDPQTIDVTVVAGVITTQNFYLERTNWILSIQTDGSGDTDHSPGAYTWPKNTEFPVEALPEPGFRLLYWLLDSVDVGSENPFPVFMDGNHNLTAVFAEESQIGLLSGKVTDLDTELPIEGAEVVVDDRSVFTDAAGNYEMPLLAGNYTVNVYEMVHYGQEAPVTVVADSSTVQNFVLERSHWTLTVEVEGLGSASLTQGVHMFPVGSEAVVEAFPDEDWELLRWILDSVDIGSENPISVSMTSDHILRAVFAEIPSPSPSPSPAPTSQPTPTPNPTSTPTPSPQPEPTPSPSTSPDATPSPSPSETPLPAPPPDSGIILGLASAAIVIVIIVIVVAILRKRK